MTKVSISVYKSVDTVDIGVNGMRPRCIVWTVGMSRHLTLKKSPTAANGLGNQTRHHSPILPLVSPSR